MDEGTAGVGARLQEIRAWRGLSLRAAAGLAGYSASYLSMIENGDRVVDKRSTLENLAAALQVSPADITGQPYPPANRSESQGHSAAPALRGVLRDIELGKLATPGRPRSLVELRAAVAAVNTACAACDYSVMGEVVPDLIGELHPLAEANGGEAWRLLAEVLHSAFYLSKDLGHGDLAWMVSGHLHRAVEATGDPVWGGLGAFVRAHAVVGSQARQRGLTLAEDGAERVHADDAEAGQVHGMLHLSAALQSAVLGQSELARSHVAAASETAARTGDGTFAGLQFGPRNVGVWRVALALELGEPGRVAELAREVEVAAIPSAGRQASFYADVGRGLATERSTRGRAVEALRRAEQLAPQRTRTNPYVRETVTDLMRRVPRDSGAGRALRGMAYRMGISA
ncbi:MAG: helix-turn-helix domain-containing protein [Pseudonocardia sp.]